MLVFYLLTFIVCGAYAVLMLMYLIGWNRTSVREGTRGGSTGSPQAPGRGTKVSIILPVRNEEKNILNVLNRLAQQEYPKELYEILVVDDLSEDGTAALISSLDFSNLKRLSLVNKGGKKKAIEEGISKASGTLIVTTDADCEMGKKWLSSIVSFYEEHRPKMIVSPVVLSGEKNLLQKVQSQEMIVLAACTGAALFYSSPTMCSGANLAYEKDAFYAVNGFHDVDKTSTGDDVFLMLKMHKTSPGQIKYLKSREAVVYTHPENSSASLLSQRKRWASKTFSYGPVPVTGIALLVFGTNLLMVLMGILSIINVKFVVALVTSFSAKCLVDFMLLHTASQFFGKRSRPLLFLFVSVFYPVYVTAIGLVSPFTQYSWKGRSS